MAAKDTTAVEVEGHRVPVSNLAKVLYPETGFTKGDVIQYYRDISPVLLPHLRDRALTMKRYPDGVGKFFFYEKNCPAYRPKWVRTAPVFSHGRGATMHYCLANNLASLVWMANLADLELHTSLARKSALTRPTALVFDLDPGDGATAVACAQVALWLREKLRALGLAAYVKTSGSKGLQLYAPLNTPVHFDQTKALARQLGDALVAEHPAAVVTQMLKAVRKNKVLIDWSQNDEHKTTVCVYSLRATPQPQVSTPLTWTEVEARWRRADPAAFRISPGAVLDRVREHGDLFAPVLDQRQKLPRAADIASVVSPPPSVAREDQRTRSVPDRVRNVDRRPPSARGERPRRAGDDTPAPKSSAPRHARERQPGPSYRPLSRPAPTPRATRSRHRAAEQRG